jgi:hypothetical protein
VIRSETMSSLRAFVRSVVWPMQVFLYLILNKDCFPMRFSSVASPNTDMWGQRSNSSPNPTCTQITKSKSKFDSNS